MKKLFLFFVVILALQKDLFSIPIETPIFDEKNELVIRSPTKWGYRTFRGKNGLIGVLWPFGTSFNSTNTVIFIFLQSEKDKKSENPDNINLFREKCPRANFKFASPNDMDDQTKSIYEKYFLGRCGRTMVLLEETVQDYTIIVALVSGRYISKQELRDAKEVAASYVKEIEKYIKDNFSESESETEGDSETQKISEAVATSEHLTKI
ncbi:MAG: hypothetical protein LBJ45_03055 [Holosporaceae bacterium]|jgi:hypothetical protein|nr:hypothetical protein [Holosporaceae bacterium]